MNIHALARAGKRLHKSKLSEGDIFVGQIEGNHGFTYLFLMKNGRGVAIISEDGVENCRRWQQFGRDKTFSVDVADISSAYSNYGPNVVKLLESI